MIAAREFPHAVVIGLDSLQGLQAARILARRHVPVIGLAKDAKHYGVKTRVCQRIVIADTDSDALIPVLESLGKDLPQKAVLFPCEDMNVLLVSRHRDRLAPWYHVMLPAADVVETLMDKCRFHAFAQEHQLPIPATFLVHSAEELERAISQLQFPCILKPSNSATPEWESKVYLSAFQAQDANELRAIYERYRHFAGSFLVQDWIVGPDTNHYTCNVYFDHNAQPAVTFTTQKIRQWPPITGIASSRCECQNTVVVRETLRLFQAANYRGLGYLEMKRDDRSGKHLIIEPNIGRPTGGSAIAEAGNVELLYTMYCDALGWPLPANRQQTFRGVKWIYWRRDLQSALYHWWRGELTLSEWWRSWRGPKVGALFSWRDPLPFLADVFNVLKALIFPKERRKRNFNNPLS
jgi:predicted ATP-grasp superfamily ATP-dependent carboligase